MKRTSARAIGALLLSAALSACASGPAPRAGEPLRALGEGFGGEGLSPFAKESLGSLSSFSLSNGIPVVLRRNPASRVLALSLVIRGGSAAATRESAGLEGLALAAMARGSVDHPYEEIQSILDETSSSLGRSAGLDYSSYNLVTLDKYLPRLLPLWTDTLLRPAFTQKDFDQVLSEAKLALQSRDQDPWASTAYEANRAFFAGHPYEAAPEGTRDSLAAMDLAAVKDWYAKAFSANRMFVVAVGDFDQAELRERLEAGIGKIPDRGFALPPPPPAFALGGGSGRLVKKDFPQSKGLAYLRGDFAAPGPESPDYMALNLGMEMLSDLLLNVVRDKHGAVYSPNAYARDSLANYGSIVLYKTKAAGQIKSYIDEAVAELAAGRVLSVDPGQGEGAQPRMDLAEALPAYKAKYANALFEGQATNAQVAARIAKSVVSSGDYRAWLLDLDRIQALRAEEVSAAVRKYLLGGRITWVLLGSADAILPASPEDYASIGAR
ncbi:MAG TPA: pitrilysin family protein [Spirochaetales bacterium]|nr:pitrilysin family protein [Spirochaetales bacterium]HRY55823.1 pitrilysin family protein [Spirochaetia bacterium]HRZ65056.1 pitrilysin family protein [Spirochaetia bacterium]